MVSRGEKGRWRNWEIGIDKYTLLYTKEITNENLLYSTGTSTYYSILNELYEKRI